MKNLTSKSKHFGANVTNLSYIHIIKIYQSRNVRKDTFGHVRPAMIQISLRISAFWAESLMGAFWIAKNARFVFFFFFMRMHKWFESSLVYMSEGTFSHVVAHLLIWTCECKNQNVTFRKYAYSNILKISPSKTESFQIKILICFIFLLITYIVSNEYPQSMYLSTY